MTLTNRMAYKVKKVSGSSATQLAGLWACLLALLSLPLILIGLALIIAGGLARQLFCSECGNLVTSKCSKLCPVCKAVFEDP